MKSVYLALLLAFGTACVDRPEAYTGSSLHRATHTTKADDAADDDDTSEPEPAPVVDELPTPADAGPPPVDAFKNAPGFTTLTPKTQSGDHHLGDSNAGKNCLACHGKDLGAPQFVLAGTVRRSASDSAGAEGVQVRVVDANGNELASVGTDERGNFWLRATGAIPPGSRVGIRDATGVQKMSASIGVGACNQAGCHSSERPIFLAK